MSVNKFCHHCGKKVIITDKFCASCGTNLSSLAAAPEPVPKSTPNTFTPFHPQIDDNDYEPMDRWEHVNIRQSQLHVEVVKDKIPSETLANVMSQGPPSPQEVYIRKASDPEQVLADLKKESSTLRNEK